MNNKHTKTIRKLGFPEASEIETTGRLSISDVFPKSKKRCGIYCFKKSNETYYIGQAVDVVRRFSQHRKNHENIACVWFQPVSKKNLDVVEKDLIFRAEKSGLPIINKSLVSSIIGETDLDFLVDTGMQEKWTNSTRHKTRDDDRVNPPEKYRIRYRDSFLKLKQNKIYGDLKSLLKTYIKNCIPFPRKTEMSFWEVSCLPSTNASHHPRYFALNIHQMEVFVVGYKPNTEDFWAFINTSKEKFLLDDKKIEDVLLKHQYSEIGYTDEVHYKSAGYDQIKFDFTSVKDLQQFLTEPRFITSAKLFNLRLMRKGGTIYSKFHCFDLIDDVFGESIL
jgi:hypothetical protein